MQCDENGMNDPALHVGSILQGELVFSGPKSSAVGSPDKPDGDAHARGGSLNLTLDERGGMGRFDDMDTGSARQEIGEPVRERRSGIGIAGRTIDVREGNHGDGRNIGSGGARHETGAESEQTDGRQYKRRDEGDGGPSGFSGRQG